MLNIQENNKNKNNQENKENKNFVLQCPHCEDFVFIYKKEFNLQNF